MSTKGSLARRLVAAVLLALLAGCQVWLPTTTSLGTLIPAERPSSVRVTLSDGSMLTVKDPILRNDSILSTEAGGAGVAAGDVRLTEIQRVSAKRTVVFIVGAVALAGTWAGILGSGGGGPGSEAPDPTHMAPPGSE